MDSNIREKQPQTGTDPNLDQQEPSWLTDHKRDKAAMRWFWRGALIALLIAFIFGVGDFTNDVVFTFAKVSLAILLLAIVLYRSRKGLKLGQRSTENEEPEMFLLHLMMFIGGVGIGFITMHFIWQLLILAANRHS